MKIFLEKVLARWWSRIIFFLLLWFIFFLPEYSYFFYFTPYLSLFLTSITTEQFRRKGSWFTLGIYTGRTMFRELFWGKIFALTGFGIVLISALLLGATLRTNEEIFIQNLLWISLRILIFATGEEFLFRGIIFQSLSEKFGAIPVMIIFSLLFMFAHSFNPNSSTIGMMNVFLANILMTMMYITTESLWPSITFHFLWNWLQFIFGIPVSGIIFGYGVWRIDLTGIALNLQMLTGGLFGVEEGLITTVFLIAAIIFVPKYLQISPYVTAKKYRRSFAESALLMKHLA